MPSHFKVHELLSREELDELEAFAREPGRTVDECHQWMLERGFTLSRSAVGTWKREFDSQLMSERLSRSSELAKALKATANESGATAIADAAVTQLCQVVFEQSSMLEANGQIDPLDVMRLTRSLKNLTGTKRDVELLLAEKFDREMKEKQTKRPGGVVTPEDIAAARKAIFGT